MPYCRLFYFTRLVKTMEWVGMQGLLSIPSLSAWPRSDGSRSIAGNRHPWRYFREATIDGKSNVIQKMITVYGDGFKAEVFRRKFKSGEKGKLHWRVSEHHLRQTACPNKCRPYRYFVFKGEIVCRRRYAPLPASLRNAGSGFMGGASITIWSRMTMGRSGTYKESNTDSNLVCWPEWHWSCCQTCVPCQNHNLKCNSEHSLELWYRFRYLAMPMPLQSDSLPHTLWCQVPLSTSAWMPNRILRKSIRILIVASPLNTRKHSADWARDIKMHVAESKNGL